jgi:hypothetical protein
MVKTLKKSESLAPPERNQGSIRKIFLLSVLLAASPPTKHSKEIFFG